MSQAIRVRVAVVVVGEEGDQILLVEHSKAGRRYWLLPGGGLETGETLVEAGRRELMEETGFTVDVGRLILVCEVIEPAGRHILNLIFTGRVVGGTLRPGFDGVLSDARWQPRGALADLDLHPAIGRHVEACWAEEFAGPVRVLGNVWLPVTPPPL